MSSPSPPAPFEIGVMLNNLERDRLKAFRVAAEQGFRVVHTSALPEAWLEGEARQRYAEAARSSDLLIDAMFVGFDGQSYTDLSAIRRTVGLVLPHYREHRCQVAFRYSDLARELGVTALAAHIGFVPHDRGHPDYGPLVETICRIADRCRENGQTFRLETGQEPAAVLRQFLEDVGRQNVGVNFDPANFLLYGTDRPLSALAELAPFVQGVHCKDGRWPMAADALGVEVPIGQGEVDFPALLAKLRAIGYRGPLVIEREHGPRVIEDVRAARDYLSKVVNANLSGPRP
ncbi:MAG TPA: sugar phosphate isomerase/epimerase family protein [Gemmataceae bacterium]|nr:sugar phosphate isomerase/epimerase family protein [Gemmataceae bacterium]